MSALRMYSGPELAGEPLNAGRFVTISGGEIVELDNATARSIGVVLHDTSTGEKPQVLSAGVVPVDIKAAETLAAANTPLTCDTGGRVTATIADGEYVNAISVAAGSAAGGKVRVRVIEPYTASIPA